MSTQWVNTQPDAGALHALLLTLPGRVPIADLDELWIFPTRRIAVGESTVVVLSLFDEDPDRRRVMTARFTVSRDKKGVAKVADKIDEYGTAPLEAVTRVVDGVVRRLGEDVEQPPRREHIDRSVLTWQDLLIELGAPRNTFGDPAPAAGAEASAAADTPDTSGTPGTSGTPDTSDTSNTSDTPDTSDTSDTSHTFHTSEAPAPAGAPKAEEPVTASSRVDG